MTDNHLAHYGIQGQKWGIRRFQNKDGTRTPEGKARERKSDRYDPDYKKVRDGKSWKEMSTKELQERTNRINAERNYKTATSKNILKKGLAVTGSILAVYGAYQGIAGIGGWATNKPRNGTIARDIEIWKAAASGGKAIVGKLIGR